MEVTLYGYFNRLVSHARASLATSRAAIDSSNDGGFVGGWSG
jgi:hypothetical protein